MADLSLSHPIWRYLFLNEPFTNNTFTPVPVDKSFFYNSNPIIIGGCGRSGTTLLASILGSFSSIYLIPTETALLCPGCYGSMQKPLPLSEINTKLPIMVETLSKYCFDKSWANKLTWCEKTPRNIHYFENIYRYFNGHVSLINIVRNGLDVILSKHSSDPSSYWVDSERWIAEVQLGIELSKKIKILTVRYEDLVTNPQKVFEEIASFTNIDNLSGFEENWYDNTTLHTDFSYGGKVSAINTSSIDKWKADTSGRSNKMLNDPKAQKLLEHFNYL